ncbi:rhodanese-like domain-containing protein [Pontibacillus yanchengensis]|uniref:Rhodanese-like domain-containing protein n=2 Tax=Pontibacillus yanchengensis TaxID=462910 RepID=A0ACC7VDL3_9BACI|nr:rhodanese-like domain-containing protein [Pontibacillus yanchengensis]MYL34735.1 rhodanese-like domain-containing protein [Pontibacillus yanchengensis]MYL52279.1 rhodanese-like domain-containing protein [Pontibacillus yanchengensis]
MRTMTAEEVRKQLEEGKTLNIVDVREDEEVEEGKIPGAKHIPLGSIEDRQNELDHNNEYVMVCRSGGRSGRATEFLEANGYEVINMEGGMLAWEGKTE